MQVNVNGVWKKGRPWVNVNGVWNKSKAVWTKAQGTWHRKAFGLPKDGVIYKGHAEIGHRSGVGTNYDYLTFLNLSPTETSGDIEALTVEFRGYPYLTGGSATSQMRLQIKFRLKDIMTAHEYLDMLNATPEDEIKISNKDRVGSPSRSVNLAAFSSLGQYVIYPDDGLHPQWNREVVLDVTENFGTSLANRLIWDAYTSMRDNFINLDKVEAMIQEI